MENLKKKDGQIWGVIKVGAIVLAVLLVLQIYSEILSLYTKVLEHEQQIETLLQAENDRLELELEQRQKIFI